MSLIVATWTGAIATVVLAVGAGFTVHYARKAFREQSSEVALLQQQLSDQRGINAEQLKVLKLQAADLRQSIEERQRDREQRHRDQAVRVFTWAEEIQADPARYRVLVSNASDRPVYDLQVSLRRTPATQSATYNFQEDPVAVLMPGDTARIPPEGGTQWQGLPAAGETWSQAWFTDAADVNWTVTSRGEITERPGPQMLLPRTRKR
jgi:hypothetical protein